MAYSNCRWLSTKDSTTIGSFFGGKLHGILVPKMCLFKSCPSFVCTTTPQRYWVLNYYKYCIGHLLFVRARPIGTNHLYCHHFAGHPAGPFVWIDGWLVWRFSVPGGSKKNTVVHKLISGLRAMQCVCIPNNRCRMHG